MLNYQCVNTIKDVWTPEANSIYQFDKERIIIGNVCGITIVNFNEFTVEKVKENLIDIVYGIVGLRDHRTVLCGCSGDYGYYLMFPLYNLYTKEYKIIRDIHDERERDGVIFSFLTNSL